MLLELHAEHDRVNVKGRFGFWGGALHSGFLVLAKPVLTLCTRGFPGSKLVLKATLAMGGAALHFRRRRAWHSGFLACGKDCFGIVGLRGGGNSLVEVC